MQTTTPQFAARAAGNMRQLSWGARFAFSKVFNAGTTFFTLDTSQLDGTDVLAPSDSDVAQEWDRYVYTDYSNRVIDMEWNREEDAPFSVVLGMADITLNNYDDYFTPGAFDTSLSPVNFGKTTTGASGSTSSTDIKSVSSAIPGVEGFADTLTLYCRLSATGSTVARGVIYSDNAGSLDQLLAITDQTTITNTSLQWINFNFTGSNQITLLAGTTYWIGFHAQDPGTPTFNYSHDSTASARKSNNETYSDGTSTSFGSISNGNGPIACYVTLQQTVQTPKPLSNFILPQRPVRLYAGFAHEDLPVFIGLTEQMPKIDNKAKTVSFHCVDFLYSLFNRPLNEAVMLEDVRTDEILDELLQQVGLLPEQYILDIGINRIPFAYFEPDTKLGDAVRELMEAEMGRVYMDELGIIRFKNRQNFSETPVYFFDKSNTIEMELSEQSEIINTVEVKSKVRVVQANQNYWELERATRIPGGGTADIWANFEDPVTDVDPPEFVATATTSAYVCNTAENGEGSVINGISLSADDLFAKSYKMTFTNANTFDIFITHMELWATPAVVTKEIYERIQDDTSVGKYDERVYTIENEYIQSSSRAQSIAHMIIEDYKDYASVVKLDVKGNPALQLGDAILVSIESAIGLYVITKLENHYGDAKFTQRITAKQRDIHTYFRLDISRLDSDDRLAF